MAYSGSDPTMYVSFTISANDTDVFPLEFDSMFNATGGNFGTGLTTATAYPLGYPEMNCTFTINVVGEYHNGEWKYMYISQGVVSGELIR